MIACGAGRGVIHQHWKRFSSCSLESGAIGLLLADLSTNSKSHNFNSIHLHTINRVSAP
jgi:hypothetical protein